MKRLVLLLAAAAAASCSSGDGEAVERPNVLLVVVDTLRADHVGVYGYERPTTPALDQLAAEGTWFRRAYAHSGWTLASTVSLLTGKVPSQHRVGRDPLDRRRFGRLPDAETTLAELLTDAGYRCGAIVNNTFLAPEFGLRQGFDGGYDYQGASNTEHRSAEASVDLALEWIAGAGDGPWFLLLHLMEPHLDYDPPASVRGAFTPAGPAPVPQPFAPPPLFQRLVSGQERLTDEQLAYVVALYDEEVLAADRAIGRLTGELEARDVLDATLVVVTSDHGEEFWDHGGFEHGHTLYSELTRVPLIVRGPGAALGEVGSVVHHADLFQGLRALAGAPSPLGTAGADLFAIARQDAEIGARYVLSENVLTGPPKTSILDGDYRLVFEIDTQRATVHRLDADGHETTVVQGTEERAAGDRLLQALEALRGTLKPIEAISGPSVPDHETFQRLKALGYLRDH